jgi:hypothetical protein
MKNKKSNKMKSRIVSVALITTLVVGGTASQASAFNPLQFIGDLRKKADSLLLGIKNNPEISKILGNINQITNIFLPQIQQFTNLSNADINRIKGALNVLAPSETQRAIEAEQQAAQTRSTSKATGNTNASGAAGNVNPLGVPSDVIAANVGAKLAAETVISKEAQEIEVQNTEQISKLVEESVKAAEDSVASSDIAQEANSSQDVLKVLASQNSNQSSISAAQLRLLALQNNNLQAIKIQLAVANQVNASTTSVMQGKIQKEVLQEQAKTVSTWRENHARYGRGS